MGKEKVLTGLDIGSAHVRAVVSVLPDDPTQPLRVIGVGESESAGLRRGSVVSMEELAQSVSNAVEMAENMSGHSIAHVVVSLGGTNVRTQSAKGVIAVGRADEEVVHEDIDRVIAAAGKVNIPPNNEIVHVIPQKYRLDDQTDIKNPVGMKGVRLEMDALVVEGFAPQIQSVLKCLHFAGLDADHFVFSPLAAAESVLDKKQRELGVLVIDIGTQTTGISVYEEGELLHTAMIPIGAAHITNDIAIGIRTSVDVAEKVKVLYGTALVREVDDKDDINLMDVDSQETGEVSRKHVAEIIEARLEELLDAVNAELKKIHREGLLPAGAVLVGGGAKLPGVIDLCKEALCLPVTIGYPKDLGGILDKIDDPAQAVATGLIKWEEAQMESGGGVLGKFALPSFGLPGGLSKIGSWFKKFLP